MNINVNEHFLCLEEFNDRILCPDLSDTEMQRLHEEVQKIYGTYCLEESIDKISFDPFIIEEIHNSQSHYSFLCSTCVMCHCLSLFSLSLWRVVVAQGPYTGVVKLQTMRCLFEAYEHVLSLLEKVFTPMFCHSDEVTSWDCFFLALLKMLCLYSSSCVCLCFSSVFSTSALGCWVSC